MSFEGRRRLRVDCTRAGYLGIGYARERLPFWSHLTTGVPAVIREAGRTVRLARQLAGLIGLASGTLYPATLHLFLDLFTQFRRQGARVLVDGSAYPIAVWGARSNGNPAPAVFPTGRLDVLDSLLAQCSRRGQRPVLLSDGWCTPARRPAPLAAYQERLAAYGGWLVVDDTQAFGLLGRYPTTDRPFGSGGGGITAFAELDTERLIVGASLAKAFGVPLAVLAGPQAWLDELRRQGPTRWHCSPPSLAHVAAAERALATHAASGDQRRERLWRHIVWLRTTLLRGGVPLRGGDFPIQYLPGPSRDITLRWQRRLRQLGVDTLVTAARPNHAALTMLLRADHHPAQVDYLAQAILKSITHDPSGTRLVRPGSRSRLAPRRPGADNR